MKFKRGDIVKVINWGSLYSINKELAEKLGATKWTYDDSYYYVQRETDTICTVISVGIQGGVTSGAVLIEAPNGKEYTINAIGIKLIKSSQPSFTPMNSILDTVKKIALKATNPHEALLREVGIHDECGNITAEGKVILVNILEEKYKADLITIAKKLEADAKKK